MEVYCIVTLYVQSPRPDPLPQVLRHVCRQRTLRRERARNVNGRQIQAKITKGNDDSDGPNANAVRKSLAVRQPRNSW